MSTRGVIGKLTKTGWRGRYHHFDSYPTGLGKFLFKSAQNYDLKWLVKFLVDEHPAGWSSIVDTDLELTPGFVNYSKENTENKARCYCHGDRNESKFTITPKNVDPLFIEWVYLFDVPARKMVIYKHNNADNHNHVSLIKDYKAKDGCIVYSGGYSYSHVLVNTFDLDGEEPNWEEMETE